MILDPETTQRVEAWCKLYVRYTSAKMQITTEYATIKLSSNTVYFSTIGKKYVQHSLKHHPKKSHHALYSRNGKRAETSLNISFIFSTTSTGSEPSILLTSKFCGDAPLFAISSRNTSPLFRFVIPSSKNCLKSVALSTLVSCSCKIAMRCYT